MISDPFARVLAAGRVQFNKQVVEARRRYPTLDTAAFAEFLATGVDTVVSAVAFVEPERLPQVVLALYGIALELTGQSLAGPKARGVAVNRVWRELAPRFARLLAAHPEEVIGLLTNAVIHLEKTGSARPAQWMSEMARLSPYVATVAQLHALGQLVAWRAGVAHFRLGVLADSQSLPTALLASAFNIDAAAWPQAREGMLADPWWGAGAGFEGVELGAFAGFGGDFSAPPQVRGCDDGFIVKSGERYFLLVADIHGAVLHAATEDEFLYAGQLTWPPAPPLQSSFDLPPQQLAVARNAHTLAVSSPYTHAIRLLPLR